MKKLLIIPLVMLGLLLASLAWSGGGSLKRAELTYIDRADIITLDPNQMSYLQDFRVSYAIREGLCAYAAGTLEPKPAGAERIESSPDKRRWTFHLRRGAVWTDGTPVTSADYVFAWRRMLQEPGDYTYLFYYIHNAEAYSRAFVAGRAADFGEVGVKAPDAYTLEVTLDNPVPFFLDLVAFVPFYPLSERSMEPFKEVGPNGHVHYRPEFTRPPQVVTNGPYVLKTWDFKRRLRMEKSPTYWDRAHVKLESIEDEVNEDRLSQVLSYESGAVDWVADAGSDISAEMRALGRKDLVVTPGFGTNYLSVNTAATLPGTSVRNPLGDVRVRQAFMMAIDKEQICRNITRMGERPATTYIPPGIFPGYRTTAGFGFDVPRARQLLAEAGYPEGRGFPQITMIFNNASPVLRDMMENVKNQLKANLNIDLALEGLEGKVLKSRFNAKNYVIGPSNWIGDYGDPSTFTDKYLSASLNNDSNWARPDYDALCAEAAKEADPAKRMALLEKAERMINTDLPVIPMYYLVNTDLVKPYVHMLFNPRMTTVWKSITVDRGGR